MMKCDLDMWKASIDIISKVEINKSDLGLNLVEIEKSINNTELVEAFTNLQVEDCSDDSDDTTESDSESSSETETSDSDCSVIDTNSRKVEKDLNKII
ncbi:SHQ1 protein [Popillia japonica]